MASGYDPAAFDIIREEFEDRRDAPERPERDRDRDERERDDDRDADEERRLDDLEDEVMQILDELAEETQNQELENTLARMRDVAPAL